MRFLIFTALVFALHGIALTADNDAAKKSDKYADLPILFQDDFEHGADHWQPSEPKAWKIVESPQGRFFSQFQNIPIKTPHRSPFNYALLKDIVVGDFVLDAKARSTKADYPHRDMCLFFGFQDPAHQYYVHLARRTDDHANQIFIVNEADRLKISTKTTPGTDWTGVEDWHNVRVVRRVGDGTIEIYFDDMNTPVMTAIDKTFTWGQVGIGCFDDTGDWDDVVLRGKKVDRPKP
jgi:hypothetical protein